MRLGPEEMKSLRAALGGKAAPGACADEEELVAFYSGSMPAWQAEAIRDHLAACPKCVELARDARVFVESVASRPPASRHFFTLRRIASAAAVLLVAGAVALPLLSTRPNPWAELHLVKADYRLAWRDAAEPPPGRPDFTRAMESYEQNDFQSTAEQLSRCVKDFPGDATALFYLGVARLLLGQAEAAVEPLEAAGRIAEGDLLEETHWYLALAHLKAGRAGAAMAELEVVVRMGSPRGPDAEKLRGEIRSRMGR